MLKRTKEFKKNILKWTKELRSGKYQQAQKTLQKDENSFCCLGVACKVFIPKNKQNTGSWKEFEFINSSYLRGDLPDEQEYAPNWLQEINYDFEDRTGTSLAELNDGTNPVKGYKETPSFYGTRVETIRSKKKIQLNFDEIADLIEAVYIHGAMD